MKLTRGSSIVAFAALSVLGSAALWSRSAPSVREPSHGWTAAGDPVAPSPVQGVAPPALGPAVATPSDPAMGALFDALGSDAIGERAKSGLAAFRADVMARGQAARFEDSALVRAWKADPASALVDIEALLTRLDTKEYSALKTQLLRAAAQVGGDRDAVQTIAAEAMRDATAIAWGREGHGAEDVSPYLPMVTEAVRAMVEVSKDSPDAAIAAALDAMAAHEDPRTRAGIRATLEVAYPTKRAEIDAAMAARGIEEPETVIGRQVLAARR